MSLEQEFPKVKKQSGFSIFTSALTSLINSIKNKVSSIQKPNHDFKDNFHIFYSQSINTV